MGDTDDPIVHLPIRGEWKRELESHPTVARALITGHLAADAWLRENATQQLLDMRTLLSLRRLLFGKIFPDVCAKLRGPGLDEIEAESEFGHYLGVGHREVRACCDTLFGYVARWVADLDRLIGELSEAQFVDEVVRAAAYTHCELIRIHPFVDGNGRTGRLCVSYFAWRYGYPPMPYERPQDEYLDAMRTWMQLRKSEHFQDYIRPRFLRGWE